MCVCMVYVVLRRYIPEDDDEGLGAILSSAEQAVEGSAAASLAAVPLADGSSEKQNAGEQPRVEEGLGLGLGLGVGSTAETGEKVKDEELLSPALVKQQDRQE